MDLILLTVYCQLTKKTNGSEFHAFRKHTIHLSLNTLWLQVPYYLLNRRYNQFLKRIGIDRNFEEGQ